MADWKAYLGDGTVDRARLERIPAPPPWRDFAALAKQRAETFKPPPDIVEVVNAALYLRRPVLVTGDPGVGKSSLAYSVAHELGLGSVITWNINSRSTLSEGLYLYDALARLREVSLARASRDGDDDRAADVEDIGRYIKLGAIGTAFVAARRPRVVLIDEIDKSDIDLPNDLLHVFENGEFEIPELVRIAETVDSVDVRTSDPDRRNRKVKIRRGLVRCRRFPVIFITSNGERDLPPAFLRRCLRADIRNPGIEQLRTIVEAHLGDGDQTKLNELLAAFDTKLKAGAMLATDQLLNAFFLVTRGKSMTTEERSVLDRVLLRDLNR